MAANAEPKARFHRVFLDQVAVLQDQIEQLKTVSGIAGERQEATDHVLAGISKLQNEVADAADQTPAYDRKQYSETIKGLQEKVNETTSSLAPKSRFQFKKSASAKHFDMGAPENDPRLHAGSLSRNPPSASAALVQPVTAEEDDKLGDLPPTRDYNEELSKPSMASIRKPSFSAARNIGISNQTGLHIILPSSASNATASGSLTDLVGCIVDLSIPTSSGQAFPGLALRNINKSLIVAGRVAGPVHITGVCDSIIVVVSRQVRIHDCKNVDIYLHCTSHPIIEDCSRMRFAPLPACYITSAEKSTENQWNQVDDFKWLKAGHSPNWTTLGESQVLGDEIWTKVVPGQPGTSVIETLKKVGIS